MTKFRFVLFLGLVFFVGTACASLPATGPTLCLPAGIAPFWDWPIVDTRPVMLLFEDGTPRPLLLVTYQRPGQSRIVTAFEGPRLVMVDPNPDQRDAPPWVDRGYFTASGQIRLTPGEPCQWRPMGAQET